jgi:hypothetical protein
VIRDQPVISNTSERSMNDDIRAEIRRQTRPLRLYAMVMTVVAGVLSLTAFQSQARTRFTEIDVERVNIVEPDGKLRMVISNRPRSIGPIYKGKPFGYPGGTRPGIIFFNDEGSENGGLTITGSRDSLGRYRASGGWAFDQYDQDETLTLRYTDNNGRRQVGLTVSDRDANRNIYDVVMQRDSITAAVPDTAARRVALERLLGPLNGIPLAANRVFLGRDVSKNAVVNLFDPLGRIRLRLRVDSLGRSSMDFLDDNGRVTFSLPDSVKR